MKQLNIQFIKNRRYAYIFSLVMLIVFTAVAVKRGGMNWGIDFTGGVKVVAQFDKDVNISSIRQAFEKVALPATVQQQTTSAERNEYIIAMKLLKGDKHGDVSTFKLKEVILSSFTGSRITQTEMVGPVIGEYLRDSAWKMTLMCIVMMTIYLAFRFEFRFSVGAMGALLHDIILSLALAGACQVEFDIPVLAAILTIFGYSVNDTIVIFDRIRERMHAGTTVAFPELVNTSINQTLSRTIITVFCTLLSVIAIFFLGGEVLHGFSLVLIFGFVIGAYSSIFIASPIVLALEGFIKEEEPVKK
jgi:preprotein translocase subunit SecF